MYLRPTDLTEALTALKGRQLSILAGGTDFYPAHVDRPLPDDVLDITALAGAARCTRGTGRCSGSARSPPGPKSSPRRLPPLFDGLKLAAREIGGRQVQNAGTLAGNLCNASPAADGVPALLALEAEVELSRARRDPTRAAGGIPRRQPAHRAARRRTRDRYPGSALGFRVRAPRSASSARGATWSSPSSSLLPPWKRVPMAPSRARRLPWAPVPRWLSASPGSRRRWWASR